MNRPDEPDRPDDRIVTAALRERLRSADEEIEVPAGLWDRIRPPDQAALPARRLVVRLPHPTLVVSLAAAVVVAVALGTWWLTGFNTGRQAPPAGTPAVTVRVYNAEVQCQELRTTECALRLAKNPHKLYAASGNRAAMVWHGERLTARCVISDGVMLRDESGITSARWYLVRTEDGVEGWLPGVRTRNAAEIPDCADGEGIPD
jgi:hypothetical protein